MEIYDEIYQILHPIYEEIVYYEDLVSKGSKNVKPIGFDEFPIEINHIFQYIKRKSGGSSSSKDISDRLNLDRRVVEVLSQLRHFVIHPERTNSSSGSYIDFIVIKIIHFQKLK